jgi:hypothetical protein
LKKRKKKKKERKRRRRKEEMNGSEILLLLKDLSEKHRHKPRRDIEYSYYHQPNNENYEVIIKAILPYHYDYNHL